MVERNFTYSSNLDDYDQLYYYDAQGVIEYIGYAKPGSLETQAIWHFIKLLYDVSGNVTGRRHANGELNYNILPADRELQDYSEG